MSSSGRTALVTGGNRGLGAAIARALDDAGHRVIITHTPGNDKVAAWLDAQDTKGYRFVAYGVDVGDWESTQALARQIQADGYHVDILVNNAGITRDATLRKMDKSGWDAVLRTNLDSMFNVTKPFIDPMMERGWGRIINISSINGSKGQFGQTNYSAAKAGVHGFTKALAQEVARKGAKSGSHGMAHALREGPWKLVFDIERDAPAAPRGRAANPAEAPWWETWGDPPLDALVRRALQASPDLRAAEARLRQARAAPAFDDLEAWLAQQLTRISGKSPLAAAIRYALARMQRMRPYLAHGILELDNNAAERGMRAIASAESLCPSSSSIGKH